MAGGGARRPGDRLQSLFGFGQDVADFGRGNERNVHIGHGPLSCCRGRVRAGLATPAGRRWQASRRAVILQEPRSEEHTSEIQSLMRISYAVFCLKNKT